MRTLLATLIFFVLASSSYGQLEHDKTLHFIGGSLFGLAGAGIAKQASKGNRVWTFVGAVAGSAIAGLAKEAVDASNPNNSWDNEDLAATVLGGVTVGLAIELFAKKDSNRRLRGRYSDLYENQPLDLNPIEIGSFDAPPSLNTLSLSRKVDLK
ncbi:hypothetical protein [Flagellimonas zhangzhouensis]|uniref:Uncharacterized protein n=1 Tax=Flagellimonas zhangzhouensis TaxID=1073328 RepID=A0A1H2XZS8_9FLAO|nr:hypothetical protein [Allomuricauda zhangzhouensis]SDQ93741.1 hypothetical protein SAMN05216294_2916 [Allomuricauda zhangzhouensis]SDW98376.1 hypothetical protein SAMN04487892_2908 [Allomuricauda zhangzhouensis]